MEEPSISKSESQGTPKKSKQSFIPSELALPATLAKIQQRKAQVRGYHHVKKLEKIGVNSSCKVCASLCYHTAVTTRFLDYYMFDPGRRMQMLWLEKSS